LEKSPSILTSPVYFAILGRLLKKKPLASLLIAKNVYKDLKKELY